ncbi:BLOC-1-related complex subunit 6-like [Brachionichthys hirsutus]|uniref:BLOC-1-related complex subunit 6-like n=1 Tax=Brachionichthys hirsutus TaxID=412623 RepID=UPI003604D9A3
MSLSPVTGTEVPETANGIVTPLPSENGPHVPSLVKYEEEGHSEITENHVEEESRVHDNEGYLEPTMHSDERTLSLSLHTSHVTDPSVPSATRTTILESETLDAAIPEASEALEPPYAALLWDSAHYRDLMQLGGAVNTCKQQTAAVDKGTDIKEEEEDGEKEKQDEEDDEKNEKRWTQSTGGRTEAGPSQRYSSSAPAPSTSTTSPPPTLPLPSDNVTCPPHVMAQVWVRNVRGMQDSKSLDEISQACGGGSGARGGGRAGQSEGRRATISSALELEGTVSQEGQLTNFITKNLEQKIKMSSKPSLDCSDSDCSGPIYRSRGLPRRPADIPPIDPAVLLDLQRHTQEVAHSVEMMMRSLNGTIQNMTALSVGYIQTYRDSVDSLGESVDMSIKGMYTLMARCEELDRSMQPIQALAAQIRDIKRTLDTLEAICK